MASALETPAALAGLQRRPTARAGIAAIGSALPDGVVSSEAIAERLGVEPDWVASRTGIVERRHALPDVTLTDVASDAASIALERAGVDAADLDLILVATSTADERVPTAAPLVAERLGADRAGAIDIGAACTGFVSALGLAAAATESGRAGATLVIGAELMSRVLDLDDPRTAGLFGDGAGAAVVVPGGAAEIGPIRLRADGAGSRAVTASHTENVVRMDGRATFRAAVVSLTEITTEVVGEAGLSLDQVDLFVYHQANRRILTAVGDRLDLAPDKVVDSIATHGNTSAASIPLALDVALADGRIGPGSTIFLGAFGAGLTWGGGLLKWGDR